MLLLLLLSARVLCLATSHKRRPLCDLLVHEVPLPVVSNAWHGSPAAHDIASVDMVIQYCSADEGMINHRRSTAVS